MATAAGQHATHVDYEVEAIEVIAEASASTPDSRLQAAAVEFKSRVPRGQELKNALGLIIRDAVDYVIDAPRMRRYAIADLEPDEKTTIGKRIERLIRMRFGLPPGDRLDIKLAGEDVDIKTSCTTSRSWMFSKNNVDRINLLIAYDEGKSLFDVGFVLVTDDILGAKNQDLKRGIIGGKGVKRQLTQSSVEPVKAKIAWLMSDVPYPSNFLAKLDPSLLENIHLGRSGAERVRRLLRALQRQAIPRRAVEAVANQKDPIRRTRGKDGARGHLWHKDNLLILSGAFKDDAQIAKRSLGLALAADEIVSVAADHPSVTPRMLSVYKRNHDLARAPDSRSRGKRRPSQIGSVKRRTLRETATDAPSDTLSR